MDDTVPASWRDAMSDLDRLRAADPAAGIRHEDHRLRVLSRALAGIAADERPARQAHRERQVRAARRVPFGRPAAVFVLAGVLTAGLLVAQTATPGARPAASSAAAAVLERAADQAAQAGSAVGDAPFVRVTRTVTSANDTLDASRPLSYLQKVTVEEWLSRDGSAPGLIRRTYGDAVYAGPGEDEANQAAGAVPVAPGTVSESVTPAGGFPGDFQPAALARFPRDPDDLYAHLDRRSGGDPGRMLTLVRDLITPATADPELVAALFRAAARIPGMERLPDTADAAGRPAAAVGTERHGARHVLLFDPDRGLFLGESITVTAPGGYWPVGTVVSESAVTVSGAAAAGA